MTALDLAPLTSDARFGQAASRVRHRDRLHALLAERISPLSTQECVALLSRHGVPVGPVQDLRQALDDPLVTARGLVRDPAGPAGGLAQVRLPIEPVGAPPATPAPGLGQHSAEVLREAGFTAAEIAALRRAPDGRDQPGTWSQ